MFYVQFFVFKTLQNIYKYKQFKNEEFISKTNTTITKANWNKQKILKIQQKQDINRETTTNTKKNWFYCANCLQHWCLKVTVGKGNNMFSTNFEQKCWPKPSEKQVLKHLRMFCFYKIDIQFNLAMYKLCILWLTSPWILNKYNYRIFHAPFFLKDFPMG